MRFFVEDCFLGETKGRISQLQSHATLVLEDSPCPADSAVQGWKPESPDSLGTWG